MLRIVIVAAALGLASTQAAAQAWIGLLKNTPAERFQEEDLRLFLEHARKALNEAPDNQPVSWENPQTRARGDITVMKSFEYKGLPCKELRVRNEVPGRKGDNTFNLCNADGKWRLLSASQLKKK